MRSVFLRRLLVRLAVRGLGRTLPTGDMWRYEPKLDGFRGLLWPAPSGSLSRNMKDLSHAFPSWYRQDVICRSTR